MCMCSKGLPWCAHVGSLFQTVSNVKTPAGNCQELQMEFVLPVTQHSCPSIESALQTLLSPLSPLSSAMHPPLCPSSHSASRSVQGFCLCVNSTSCWPLNDLQSYFSILSSPALSPWITQQKRLLQLEIDGKSWGFLSGNYAGYHRCPMTTGGRCDLGVSGTQDASSTTEARFALGAGDEIWELPCSPALALSGCSLPPKPLLPCCRLPEALGDFDLAVPVLLHSCQKHNNHSRSSGVICRIRKQVMGQSNCCICNRKGESHSGSEGCYAVLLHITLICFGL